MSFTVTNDTVTITLPTIPFLSSYPFSVSLPTSSLRTGLRLVVIIATYILFRPHIERVFRTMLGRDDPAAPQSVEGMRRQMGALEKERGVPIGGGRKVAVATASGAGAVSGQGQNSKPRRKA